MMAESEGSAESRRLLLFGTGVIKSTPKMVVDQSALRMSSKGLSLGMWHAVAALYLLFVE